MNYTSTTSVEFTNPDFFESNTFFFDGVLGKISDEQYDEFKKFGNLLWLEQLCFSEMVAYFAYTELATVFNADKLKEIAQEELAHSFLFKKIYQDVYGKPYRSLPDRKFNQSVIKHMKETGFLKALVDFYIRELRLLAILKQVYDSTTSADIRNLIATLLAEESQHTYYIIDVIKTQFERLTVDQQLDMVEYYKVKAVEHFYLFLPEIKNFLDNKSDLVVQCYSGSWYQNFSVVYQKRLIQLNNLFNVTESEISSLIQNKNLI